MSATDKLRAMLNECGVEWESEDCPSIDGKVVYRYTNWGDGYGVSFCEPIGAKPGTLSATCDFSAIGFTPEQAVAASLGHSLNNPSTSETLSERGTCHIIKRWSDSDFINDWKYLCSECGCPIPVYERDEETGDVIRAANFCSNCGAKVKKVES